MSSPTWNLRRSNCLPRELTSSLKGKGEKATDSSSRDMVAKAVSAAMPTIDDEEDKDEEEALTLVSFFCPSLNVLPAEDSS